LGGFSIFKESEENNFAKLSAKAPAVRVFMLGGKKEITQPLYQKLRDYLANPVDYDTRDAMHPIEKTGCFFAP